MKKILDLVGLANAVTDCIITVTDAELHYAGFKKGAFNRKRHIDLNSFLDFIEEKEKVLVPGGSPANTIRGASNLGLHCGLFGSLGTDLVGKHYIKNLNSIGVDNCFDITSGRSGICYALITPDGERSMMVDMGQAETYGFDISQMNFTKIFHTSGYELLSRPDKVMAAIEYAKSVGAKISFDLAAENVVEVEKKNIDHLINNYIDILFVTEEEAEALVGVEPEKAVQELSKLCEITLFKKGKKGSVVLNKGLSFEIPIYPVKVVNTTGAGDSYAAGFLFGYVQGIHLEACGHLGSQIASKACGQEMPYYLGN